jgi:hypothetical protein
LVVETAAVLVAARVLRVEVFTAAWPTVVFALAPALAETTFAEEACLCFVAAEAAEALATILRVRKNPARRFQFDRFILIDPISA